MIIKNGIDIVSISRITDIYNKYGNKFLHKIFTDSEVNYAKKHGLNDMASLAKRFAAKEAFAKAMGVGIGSIGFKDIEVTNNQNGAPTIVITSKISNFLKELNHHNIQCSVSLSDDHNIAIASVILLLT